MKDEVYLMDLRFILTPFFLDQALPGLERLKETGWFLNKPALPEGSKIERISALHAPLAAQVTDALQEDQRPVSIAGDCLSAIAVTAGIQRAGMNHLLIWFDAHGDFNTWDTTPSGFLGGMPLAMLVGRGEQTLLEALKMKPHPEERVVFTDGRDLDPLEAEALGGSRVLHLPDVSQLLAYDFPDLPIHVHFDTDILDPEVAPAMNYLAPGGPGLEQLEVVFQHLAKTGRIMAVSLSSWNPGLDLYRPTQDACMKALESLLLQEES
jgi:arginase